jgi:hypothetical protein
MTTAEKWLDGLIGGIIAASAQAVIGIVSIADLLQTRGGWIRFGIMVGIAGIVGAALFLRQHPTPWSGVDRRTDSPTQGEQICPPTDGK